MVALWFHAFGRDGPLTLDQAARIGGKRRLGRMGERGTMEGIN